MTKWISVKDGLPPEDTIVKIKMTLLFTTVKESLYLKKYFNFKGENITKWVTHWMLLPEPPE
jgi:hypothetical protein